MFLIREHEYIVQFKNVRMHFSVVFVHVLQGTWICVPATLVRQGWAEFPHLPRYSTAATLGDVDLSGFQRNDAQITKVHTEEFLQIEC